MAFIVISVFSCNKIPNHAKYIPKNALGVFAVDMDKLSKKLIWNVLTGSEIFDEMQKDVKNEESKKAMKDFSNIGIDPTSTLYIFYTGNMQVPSYWYDVNKLATGRVVIDEASYAFESFFFASSFFAIYLFILPRLPFQRKGSRGKKYTVPTSFYWRVRGY